VPEKKLNAKGRKGFAKGRKEKHQVHSVIVSEV
jgi:hypothetical protein